VELSLKEASRQLGLEDLSEGQTVRGRVRRVERFGVFVTLAGSAGLTGLAHISEVADEKVEDLAQLFQAGQGALTNFFDTVISFVIRSFFGCLGRPQLGAPFVAACMRTLLSSAFA
jgi:hypothetical protein